MTASILQWLGAAGLLAAFALSQRGTWAVDRLSYLVVNLVAGVCLSVSAALGEQWGYTFLEGAWALIALRGISRWGRSAPSGSAPARSRRP